MKSVIKSIVLVLSGAFLASVVWHLSVVPRLQLGINESIAKPTEKSSEFQEQAIQSPASTSAIVYLAMDLEVLKSPPEKSLCLLREFAEMKYQTVIANRKGAQPHEEPTIKDYEALEENTACINHRRQPSNNHFIQTKE